jgi:hypothetical protein
VEDKWNLIGYSCDKVKENTMDYFKKGERVVATNGERGTVTADQAVGNENVRVLWDSLPSSTVEKVSGVSRDREEKKFKRGDIVQVVGVGGEGEVVNESTEFRTLVRWSNGTESGVLTGNLRLVKKRNPAIQAAIDEIEERKKALIRERNDLDGKISNLNETLSLLKRIE